MIIPACVLMLAVAGLATGCSSQRPQAGAPAQGPASFTGGGTDAVSPSAKGIGFSVPLFPYLSRHEQLAWLSDFRALGITWIRIDISWAIVQPARGGSYHWARYDRAVAEADSHGIHVDAQADYSTPWADSRGCARNSVKCQPKSPRLYAAYAAAIARHFGRGISAEEIWNEPNNVQFWHPRPNPAFYVRMLRDSYVAIKAVNPRLIVVSGGLAPEPSNGTDLSAITFARDMFRDGAQGYFNAFGYHPYSYPALPDENAPWSGWSQMGQTRPSIRSVLAQNGDAATPIWITEVGAPTDGPGKAVPCGSGTSFRARGRHVSQCLQAKLITEIVQNERSSNWLGPAFIYSFQDLSTNQADEHDFFGIRTARGTAKASYAALKRAIAASTGPG
jgi:polysaccharide biosynthesis protein PslG